MKRQPDELKATAVALRAQGMTIRQVVATMGRDGLTVSRSSVDRWCKEAVTELVPELPEAPAQTLDAKLRAIREILAGGAAPDWLTQQDFVDLSRVLAQAENHHRLSQVRLTETGLTRPDAVSLLRRVALEVEKRYKVRGNAGLESVHEGFVKWMTSAVADYNPTLAGDL